MRDYSKIALPGNPLPVLKIPTPAHKRDWIADKFLKGPIPWRWLCASTQLPGKAAIVGLGLWHLVGMRGNYTVSLSNQLLKQLGVDRSAKTRGLKRLEEAGLVIIHRQDKKNPVVTVLKDAGVEWKEISSEGPES